MEAWNLLLRTYKEVTEKLKQELYEQHDLKLSWFDVLTQLRLAGGRLRMTELADSVLISTSGLTRLLDRMEEDGLIERTPCPDDRRGQWAVLSPAGRRRAREAWPTHRRGIDELFLDHLTKREVEVMRSALSKVLEDSSSATASRS